MKPALTNSDWQRLADLAELMGNALGPNPVAAQGTTSIPKNPELWKSLAELTPSPVLRYQASRSVTEKARKGTNTLGDLRLGFDFLYLSLHLQNDKSQTDFRIFHALMFCEIILAKCFENWRMLLFRSP